MEGLGVKAPQLTIEEEEEHITSVPTGRILSWDPLPMVETIGYIIITPSALGMD